MQTLREEGKTVDAQIQEILDRAQEVDDAELSGRLLPDHLDGEEWVEERILDGEEIRITYYFEPIEVLDAQESNPDNPPEELPWDGTHVVHITTRDGDCIVTRDFAGFGV